MADKSVGELIAAQSVTPTDLFVLEQNGTAKKLTGQILENWLVSFADGHGGIQNIAKLSTSGLADTYRITLADTTTFDFVVTNGKGVSSLRKTGTSGLVDTYTFTYNDGTTGTFTVTNGEKGDQGDTAYIWVKYASQEPTASSHSFGDDPDDWIGIYYGFAQTAPTDWTAYTWYQIRGDIGKSAYDYAREGGYFGTEEEYAAEVANLADKVSYLQVQSLSPEQQAQARENINAVDPWYVQKASAPPVVQHLSGKVIEMSDSAEVPLQDLKLYGKTVQNGTPAPEAPVLLESIGEGGSVEVMLTNNNLLHSPYSSGKIYTANGLTFTVQNDGSIVINGTATAETLFNLATLNSKTFYLPKGMVTFSGVPSGTFGGNLRPQLWVTNGAGYSFSVYEEGKTVDITTPGYYRIAVDIVAGNTLTDYVVKPMVNLGETALPFESPVSHQTLAISTPNGLPGIPVSSGGNHTDESGQQWICDEVDFEKGVYIQRVKAVKLADLTGGYNGTNFYFTSTADKKIGSTNLLCSHYPVRAGYDDFTCKGNSSEHYVYIYDSRYTDFNTLKAEMGDADIIYELATPIETALSIDELTAYAALHTNYPNTTIFNDGGADMEVRYVADTKTYVDEKHLNGFVGAFSGTFDTAQMRLATGIYLKSGKKYFIKKTKEIGMINLFIDGNTSVYRRMRLGIREAYFTPAKSGNLFAYNVNGDIGDVAIEVYDADSITVKLDDIPKVYTVGKNQQDYDYTSFTQCLLDLKDDYSPKIIYINEGDYDIHAEYQAAGVPVYTGDSPTYDFPDYCVYIPPNTHVIGRGVVRLMWMPDPEETNLTYNESVTVSPVNCAGTMTLENVEIHCKNGRYCIHDDPLGDAEFTNAIKKYINVRCYKYANDTGFGFNATIGFGVDRTMRYEFHNCLFKNEGTGAAFYMHDRRTVGGTNLSAEMGSNLIVSNCVMDASGTSCVKFGNSSSVAHIRVDFNSCWFSGRINCVNEDSSAETVYPNSWDLKLCLCNQVEINVADTGNLYPPAVYS